MHTDVNVLKSCDTARVFILNFSQPQESGAAPHFTDQANGLSERKPRGRWRDSG